MSVAGATPQQLKELSDFVVMQRAIVGQFMRTMNQMNALNNSWNATISAIVGTPAGTVINDTSGLAGIVPLTDTDVYAMVGYIQGCLASYYDTPHQQIMVRACGPGNSI